MLSFFLSHPSQHDNIHVPPLPEESHSFLPAVKFGGAVVHIFGRGTLSIFVIFLQDLLLIMGDRISLADL